MASVNTYLNFNGNTEDAFTFYKSVFGTDFLGPIHRMGETPPQEGQPEMSESDKNLVMHVALPILGGHVIMGTDAVESMGMTLNQGNNVYIALQTDTRAEADTLFAALAEGGNVEMALADQFWGDYFGSLVDKFGARWMVYFSAEA